MLTNFENLSFQVLTIRRSGHEPGHFKVAARPFAALSLRLDGVGKFYINGKEFISREGDITYIPTGMSYEVEYSYGTPNEVIVAHLYPCNYNEEQFIARDGLTSLRPIFDNILNAFNCQATNRVKSLIYSLLDDIETERKSSNKSEEIMAVAKYFEENFSDCELNIDKVCKVFYISRNKLQRMFLFYFGTSPWHYLMKIRMKYALQTLCSKTVTVGEVAVASGFSNVKYFSEVFKNTYGILPSKVKKNHNM